MAITTEIDLSESKGKVAREIVRACERYGFFTLVNHGVPQNLVQALEQESILFFNQPKSRKMGAGPDDAKPYGYGSNTIGPSGDRCGTVGISYTQVAASEYAEAVRKLTGRLLGLTAKGLGLSTASASILTDLIKNNQSDSILRLNHYPPSIDGGIGFGEHSDPQIFTLLRSNDVPGLQIRVGNQWIPITPNPSAFCVFVGDNLHALTNGRFVSVRHRALTNSSEFRMSIAFFGAPSLADWIFALPEVVTANKPLLYNPYT
ncbi:hypothetical protein FH972_015685 [Carpinus fangiana]|uniref:Fe2OG dioxygenase domain-containing protein n=1 Tax=Carpinus fangiana TaxID=176857 RepID=A0A5N6REP1_9ROSI|nr:hypothetical protein FH972_015685 [Carpinus fangiana]